MTTPDANIVDSIAGIAGVDAGDETLRRRIARQLARDALRGASGSRAELNDKFSLLAFSPFSDAQSRFAAARARSPELDQAVIKALQRGGERVQHGSLEAIMAATSSVINEAAKARAAASNAGAAIASGARTAALVARTAPAIVANEIERGASTAAFTGAVARQRIDQIVSQLVSAGRDRLVRSLDAAKAAFGQISKFFVKSDVHPTEGSKMWGVAATARAMLLPGLIAGSVFVIDHAFAAERTELAVTTQRTVQNALKGPTISTQSYFTDEEDDDRFIVQDNPSYGTTVGGAVYAPPQVEKDTSPAWNPRKDMSFEAYNARRDAPQFDIVLGDRQPSPNFIEIATATMAAASGDQMKASNTMFSMMETARSCMAAKGLTCKLSRNGVTMDFNRGEYTVALAPVSGFSTKPLTVVAESRGQLRVVDQAAFGYVRASDSAMDIAAAKNGGDEEYDEEPAAPAPH